MPSLRLVARSAICSVLNGRPIFLAVQRAVAGMICISPDAPTCERASMMKRDSWRISP